MKKYSFLAVLCTFVGILFFTACNKKQPLKHSVVSPELLADMSDLPKNNAKKKITVFMSCGGGGHISVSNALKAYLEPDYEIKIVNIFEEVLQRLDPIRTVTFSRYTCEDMYNFLLKHQLIWFINNVCLKYGAWQIVSLRRDVERYLLKYLRKDMPDLIISDIPVVNAPLLQVSKKLNIPFLVLTNDLDTSNYVIGMKEGEYGDSFCYTLPFDDEVMRQKIAKAKIPEQQLAVTGFPLRPDFYMPKNVDRIKEEFQIPADKPTVMLLMGGAGSEASYRYAKQISKMKVPLHLLVCLGRNEELGYKIRKLKCQPGITMSTIGFTSRISDLMAASDVLITKPGPGSISEAIYMNLPMLLDVTSRPIRWERLNIAFVEKWGFGESVHSYREVPYLLTRYLHDKKYYASIKHNLQAFPKIPCQDKIRQLVAHMLAVKDLEGVVETPSDVSSVITAGVTEQVLEVASA